MYTFNMKLLYNEKEFCCTKTEILSFKFTLLWPKVDIINRRLESKSLDFSGDIPVDFQPAIFYYYSILVN